MKIETMKYQSIKEWQTYMHELGFGIAEAGDHNNNWYFISQCNMTENKETKKTDLTGGAKFIMPNPWKI